MLGLATGTELRLAAYGVLLAAICGYVLYHDHVEIAKGRAQELASLRASSDKLLAQAQKDIAAETAQHQADVKANQEKTDAALKAYDAVSSALDQRVRDFNAYRASHPGVARPASGSGPAVDGECGTLSCGELASRALQDSDELARSVGELSALLKGSQRERDSLTGLPR